MRIFQSVLFLALFLIVITVLAVFTPAQAAERPGYISSGTFLGDSRHIDYTTLAYLRDAYSVNNAQMRQHEWDPSRWGVGTGGCYEPVIQRFYKTGLIIDQDIDDGIPVLEVGDLFLRLSDQDKRKVLMSVDMAYGITQSSDAGVFYVEHDRTNEVIAAYTKQGMQLQ